MSFNGRGSASQADDVPTCFKADIHSQKPNCRFGLRSEAVSGSSAEKSILFQVLEAVCRSDYSDFSAISSFGEFPRTRAW